MSDSSTQGYLVLALGPRQYIEMAASLAASIRVMDPKRQICLVHDADEDILAEFQEFFDGFTKLEPDSRYSPIMNKLRMYDASPYAETMFVDADCLMVKRDVDRYWDLARDNWFAITGDRRTSGEWKGADVAALLRQEGAPYLVQMNSGVFRWKRCKEAEAFFRGLNEYFLARRDHLKVGLHRGRPDQTDEIYIGLYMGLRGMDAVPGGGRIGRDSWMVSTWRGLGARFDGRTGRSTIWKPRGRLPFCGWDRLSPTFAHFIGLKPRRLYRHLAAEFRGLRARRPRGKAGR